MKYANFANFCGKQKQRDEKKKVCRALRASVLLETRTFSRLPRPPPSCSGTSCYSWRGGTEEPGQAGRDRRRGGSARRCCSCDSVVVWRGLPKGRNMPTSDVSTCRVTRGHEPCSDPKELNPILSIELRGRLGVSELSHGPAASFKLDTGDRIVKSRYRSRDKHRAR
jgi:hypothetical protein